MKIRLLDLISWSFEEISFSTPNTTPSLPLMAIEVLSSRKVHKVVYFIDDHLPTILHCLGSILNLEYAAVW